MTDTSSSESPPAKAPSLNHDTLLVRAVLRDEDAAVGEFVTRIRCVPRILNSLNGRAGRPLDAQALEALTQDALVAVWGRLGSYDGTAPLESWAYRVCKLTFAQRRKIRADFGGKPSVDLDDVHRCLELLPPDESRVIELRHFEGLGFEEVAQRIELSEADTKSRYYRGRLALQEHLRARLEERT